MILSFFLTYSWTLWAQNFVHDIEAIKLHLSSQALNQYFVSPGVDGVPGVYFTSFMSRLYRPPLELCYTEEGHIYEVLFVSEGPYVPLAKGFPPPMKMLVLKYKEREEKEEKDAAPTAVAKESPEHIVHFRRESMDEILHYANDRVEFSYSSGMQIPVGVTSPKIDEAKILSEEAVRMSQVNWVKKADLKLHLTPGFHLNSVITIQETLGPMDEAKSEKASSLDKMRFQTNQVNVYVGTKAEVSERVAVKSGVVYEDAPQGSSVGLMSGLDVRIPRGGQLLVFTSYKMPVQDFTPNPFLRPVATQGGAAGIDYLTPFGVSIRAGVSGVGSDDPKVEGGISIPLDIPTKK